MCLITFNSRGCSTSKIGANCLVDLLLILYSACFLFYDFEKSAVMEETTIICNLDNTVPKWHNIHDGHFHNLSTLIYYHAVPSRDPKTIQ